MIIEKCYVSDLLIRDRQLKHKLSSKREEKGRVVAVTQYNRERESRGVLLSFVKSIQERDIVTYEHSRRVATYAQRLARYLGWSRREAYDLALAALVHDLGKTWITNEILNKSEALSADERRTMERHPVIGARILIGCDVHPFYVETVLYHHEAWDGHGYPTGLHGEEIPLSARILSIADVYDALTSQRPYKVAITDDSARQYLFQGAATNFDPTIVHAFLHLLDTNPNFRLEPRVCALPQITPPMQHSPFLAGI
jgi:putative nucleotidyltransferase with HDIG domain